jgi:phosphatidylserine/phosphatidylglycerophosphate/cardiolipin synthase-like enzyme
MSARSARPQTPVRSARKAPRPLLRALLVAFCVSYVPSQARGPLDGERAIAGVRLFYGARADLRAVDEALIGQARESLDMAAYALSDRRLIAALEAAARRGVKIRLYLDPDQPTLTGGPATAALASLLRAPGVEARVKTAPDLMHLKSYQIDRRALRTGSSNFTVAGGSRQENDVLVLESAEVVAAFLREFDYLWERQANLRLQPERLPLNARGGG